MKQDTLSHPSTYTFNASKVNKIIDKFCVFLEKSPENFEKAIEKDAKNYRVKTDLEKLKNIANTYKREYPLLPTFTSTLIEDGYGNLCVMYDGSPYVTLKLLISSLRTHNNIVFFTKNYLETNNLFIEVFNMLCNDCKYTRKFASLQNRFSNNAIIKKQNLFDLIIYVGDKRAYRSVQKQLRIPSIFNGYKVIDIYIEDKSFKEVLLAIDKQAYANEIQVNYFNQTDLDDTINYINKYNLNDCFVVFTRKSEIAYKFINSLKCKNVFINKDPFVDYEFDLNENQLVYTKKIKMKI